MKPPENDVEWYYLTRLTANELRVLYYKCLGWQHADIAKKLGYQIDTIHHHSSEGQKKLDLKPGHWRAREKELQKRYCKKILDIVESSEDIYEGLEWWPPKDVPVPPELIQVIHLGDQGTPADTADEKTPAADTVIDAEYEEVESRFSRGCSSFFYISLVLTIVIAGLAYVTFLGGMRYEQAQQTPTLTYTPTATSTPTKTGTPLPTATPWPNSAILETFTTGKGLDWKVNWGDLEILNSGGNTNDRNDGYILTSVQSGGDVSYLIAPEEYLGDWTQYRELRFDMLSSRGSSLVANPSMGDVTIMNGDLYLKREFSHYPNYGWTTYSIPLFNDQDWILSPKVKYMTDVLSNVTKVYIRCEFASYHNGFETTGFDNIMLIYDNPDTSRYSRIFNNDSQTVGSSLGPILRVFLWIFVGAIIGIVGFIILILLSTN
jgi:hypothetical protein